MMVAIIAKFRRIRGVLWAEVREGNSLICEVQVENESRAALEDVARRMRDQANEMLYKAECLEEAAYRIL